MAHVKPLKPRILEIAEFAERMRYRRLGLVFCAGLVREGKLVADFLRSRGVEIVSAICKVGQVPKETIGIADDQKIAIGRHESMCNPISQAMLMNAARTEFNVLLGLCVGHDSLLRRAPSPSNSKPWIRAPPSGGIHSLPRKKMSRL